MSLPYKIVVGDCAKVIPTLKHQYPFVFADPPFNIGHPYKGYNDNNGFAELMYDNAGRVKSAHPIHSSRIPKDNVKRDPATNEIYYANRITAWGN